MITYREILEETEQYIVKMVGGSVGTKNPSNAKGYKGYKLTDEDTLMSQEKAKEKAKRMNKNLSPGEKKYYGIKYVVLKVEGNKVK